MRKELVQWLDDHGHWGVHRSALLNKKCPCLSRDNGKTNSACRRCLGTGHMFVDYIVKLDKRTFSPEFVRDAGVGEARVGDFRYYLERIVPVKQDDLILEVELDESTLLPVQPFRIREAYRVKAVEDMRDRGGRLEFVQLVVDTIAVR